MLKLLSHYGFDEVRYRGTGKKRTSGCLINDYYYEKVHFVCGKYENLNYEKEKHNGEKQKVAIYCMEKQRKTFFHK